MLLLLTGCCGSQVRVASNQDERMRSGGFSRATVRATTDDNQYEVVVYHNRASSAATKVMFVHGVPGAPTVWLDVIANLKRNEALEHQMSIFVVELVGHGESHEYLKDESFEGHALILDRVLRSLGFRPSDIVIAHSYGAEIAWLTASNMADPPRMVLMNSSGFRRKRCERSRPDSLAASPLGCIGSVIAKVLPQSLGSGIPSRKAVRDELELLYGDPRSLKPDTVRFYLGQVRRWQSVRSMLLLGRAELRRDDHARVFKALRSVRPDRVVLVWGVLDRYYTASTQLRSFMAALPRVRCHLIESAGHSPHEESPIQTAQVLRQAIEYLSVPRSNVRSEQ